MGQLGISTDMAMNRPKLQKLVPTTGQTVTIFNSDNDNIFIVSPATSLAALTINFPSLPHDGQVVFIFFSKLITTLTLANGSFNNSPTMARATSGLQYVYDLNSTTWLRNTLLGAGPMWYKGVPKPNATYNSTSGTTTSGVATFYLTDDNTSAGNALFSTVYLESLTWWINDSANQYSVGSYTLAGNKKSFTLAVTRLTTSNTNVLLNLLGTLTSVLTGINNTAVPDGTVVNVGIWGE